MKRLLLLASTLFALQASAANLRFLVPIRANDVPGANGSIWRTTLAITNLTNQQISVGGLGGCSLSQCPGAKLLPKETILGTASYMSFLEIAGTDATGVTLALRVRDISRQSQTWGTAIPVINDAEAFENRVLSLVDIPVNGDFRSMLRVYDFEPLSGEARQVSITYYDIGQTSPAQDELIVTRTATFTPSAIFPFTEPRMITLPLETESALAGHSRIRIEVAPLTPSLRFWAFVSVTNNATQHVTVIAPQ